MYLTKTLKWSKKGESGRLWKTMGKSKDNWGKL